MAKSKKKTQQQTLSPKQYIQQKIRTLEIGECYMTAVDIIEKFGRGFAVVSRRHKSGNVSFAIYLLDAFCMGVTDTSYALQMTRDEFEEKIEKYALAPCEYNVVHNMIYGAVEFASEAGINPCADFALTKFFLEEDDDNIPLIEYDYGDNGMHHLFTDNILIYNRYLPLLKKNLGEGNFRYTLITGKKDDDDNSNYSSDYDKHYRVDYSYKHPEYPSSIDVRQPRVYEILSTAEDYLTDSEIDELLAFPPDDLRHDIGEIITNALYRYADYTEEDFDTDEQFNWHTIVNSITMLGETGYSEKSVKQLLELMRQSNDFYNMVFGDTAEVATIPTLAKLADGHEQMLVDFIKEPGLSGYFKGDAITALSLIAVNNPDRRKEFVEILRDLIVFATEKMPQKNPYFDIWDTGYMLFFADHIKAVELLPEIEAWFATGEVDEDAIGDFDYIRENFTSADYEPTDLEYLFDIKERFAELRSWAEND